MSQGNLLEEELKLLNGILRKESLTGYVQYHNDLPDSRYHGFWYFNTTSRGFLGRTHREAREALVILIESVKSVSNQDYIKKNWVEKIKKLIR